MNNTKSSMNIAMVVYSHYSRDARVRRYAETMARKGIRVDVVCLKEAYTPKEKEISLIKYPIPRKRFGRLWYLWEYFLFFLYATVLLTINYLRKKYKIVHIHNMPDVLVFTALVPKFFGANVILDMHDPMPELYMSKYKVERKSPEVRFLILLERLSFNFADHIITANPEFRKIFLARYNNSQNKISVILNCPDGRIFEPQNTNRKSKFFTLLYMGTVDERFGLDIAVEAVKKLIDKIPNLRFLIIPKIKDEGKYFESLKKTITEYKLSSYICLESPQSLEKIARKLKEADIGVVLAKNGVFPEIIFPVKLLEFIQMNVPVIASKTKILSQHFNSQAIYFLKENTPQEFVQATLNLWHNQNLRENLAKNAKNYLQKHNWEKEEEKYLGLVMSVINKSCIVS